MAKYVRKLANGNFSTSRIAASNPSHTSNNTSGVLAIVILLASFAAVVAVVILAAGLH
jgi:hypothetical protein